MEPLSTLRNRTLFLLALAGGLAAASPAGAQPPPPPPGPPAPGAVPPGPGAVVMPAAAPDPIAIALAPRPGGLTPQEVAKVVSGTKHSVRAKQEELKAAAARVDQALVTFFPRVSVSATYTRLSPVVPFALGGDQRAPNCPPGMQTCWAGLVTTVLPKAPTSPQGQVLTSANILVTTPLSFDVPLNSTALVASVALPVSDYVLRLAQGYSAASHNRDSARYAAEAEALQAGADAKIAYFNWVRARGTVIVAQEAVDQTKAHLEDAKKAFAVGLASKADVLRVDAQVAAAEQAHAESMAFASVAQEQLRVLLGLPPEKGLEIGSDVMNEPATPPGEVLAALQDSAVARRLEVKSLDAAIASLKQVEAVNRAGYFPRVDAFADATYANPNQRIFPATQTWNGTWDAGVRLSWTLNDTFTTIGAVAEAKARVAALIEQRGTLQDGLRVEVASAYADVAKAPATIAAADRGVVAAEESLRVRRELFRNGKATSTELIDAEGEMTQARLRRLDAHIGLLVARARLDHATGRDTPMRPTGE